MSNFTWPTGTRTSRRSSSTGAGYDGVAVIALADEQALAAAFQDEAYLSQVRSDEPNFIGPDNCLSFIGDGLRIK